MTDFNRVRVLFSDHLNIARGKYLPARVAARGVSRHCLSLFALGYDREMTPAAGTMMLEGLPDLEAVFDPDDVRASWESGTGVVIADLQRNAEPLPLCPRNALRRAVEAWRALGYWPKLGIEFEAYIFQPGESGEWVPYDTPGAYVYGTGAAVDPAGLIDEIWAESESCGFPLEFINSEYDYPQFEFTMSYDDALAAVDDAFLFRLMAREVAIRRGYRLSYMPKPINGRSGNGLHFNFSLADASGNNIMADTDTEDGLSELARQCLAGLVAHHEGMTALLAPTVNSYRRLRPAQLTPYWANWGYDHRGTAVRVPAERGRGTRLEHRLADGAANLYVAAAAVLHAAHLGTVEKPELPPAETADGLETASTDRVVPENLGAALKVLQQDQSLIDAVGTELVTHFCDIKQAEWERYLGYTTDWEINEYRDFL